MIKKILLLVFIILNCSCLSTKNFHNVSLEGKYIYGKECLPIVNSMEKESIGQIAKRAALSNLLEYAKENNIDLRQNEFKETINNEDLILINIEYRIIEGSNNICAWVRVKRLEY